MDHMDAAKLIREIEILGSLMPEHVPPGTRIGNGEAVVERSVSAREVVDAIEATERDGIRALILVIDCIGGDLDAGCRVFNRLRAFSDAGGGTVAYVREGQTASTGPLVVEAADLVLMHPRAKLVFHGSHGPHGVDTGAADEAYAELLHRRTGFPLEKLLAYCADPYVLCELHDLAALRTGFADFAAASLESARSCARLLAQGVRPEAFGTPRAVRLAAGAAPPLVLNRVPGGVAAHVTQSSDSSFVGNPWVSTDVAMQTMAARNLVGRTAPAPNTGGDLMDVWGVLFVNGRWIIVGGETGAYAYPFAARSYDGSTWSTVYMPSGVFGAPLRAVVWNESTYVVVGSQRCYTSPDAITWTQRTIGAFQWNGLAWDGAQHVAVGQRIATSPDGITWTERATPTTSLMSVCWTGTAWVAVGGLVAYRSTDGVTWNSTVLPGSAGAFDAYMTVTAMPGRVVAMGVNNAAAYSDDGGATWTQIMLPALPDGGSRVVNSVIWTGSIFVAVQDSSGPAAVFTSSDGRFWSIGSSAMPNPNGYTAIGWSGSGLLLAGPSVIATSHVGRA